MNSLAARFDFHGHLSPDLSSLALVLVNFSFCKTVTFVATSPNYTTTCPNKIARKRMQKPLAQPCRYLGYSVFYTQRLAAPLISDRIALTELDALFTHFETHGRAAYAYERTGLKTSRYQTGFITNTMNWLMVRFSPPGSFVGLSSAARSESADDPFSMSGIS